jgi:hypothetical protein
MMKNFLVLVSVIVLTACLPSIQPLQTQIAATLTPTHTVPNLLYSTPRVIPTVHISDPKEDHPDGMYTVGVDMAPGIWKSPAGSDGCYWKIFTSDGQIRIFYYGPSGETMQIEPTDDQVYMMDCGAWIFLSNP